MKYYYVGITIILAIYLIAGYYQNQTASAFFDECREAAELTVEQCLTASEYLK